MDTQNTPVHIRLWHRDFWLLALANLVLSTVVYMQLSTLANAISADGGDGLSNVAQGASVSVYGLGIFILGPYCHYLVQRFPRKRVCQFAIVAMALISVLMHFVTAKLASYPLFITGVVGMFWFGAFFGLAQMVLSSTLVIDVTESTQRTEANYASAWFRRFGIAIGPILTILCPVHCIIEPVCIYFYIAALVLLLFVHIPFKTPDDDTRVFGLDRFLMSQGFVLTITLLPITVILGMSASMAFHNVVFFYQLALGFVIAFLAEKFVFANADLESEFVSGAFLIIAALLLYLTRSGMPMVEHLSPCLIGIGSGLIGSRMLLFFIKLAHHCQRGTAQSSFFLSWEFGFAIGLFLTGWLVDYKLLDTIGLVLAIAAILVYHFFTHPWYMRHKSR